MKIAGVRRAFVVVSVLLFAASLTQDGYSTSKEVPVWEPSFQVLLFGWMGVGSGGTPWLANPALALAWALLYWRAPRAAALRCALVSLALALSFLLQFEVCGGDSGGGVREISGYGLGYWLWIASIAATAVGCMPPAGRQAGNAPIVPSSSQETGANVDVR